MSIDAVALLRIPFLPAPSTGVGTTFLVQHRADCSLLHTMQRFAGTPLDEHVLTVRRILGSTLDSHDDPRGVFVFPDVCEPTSTDYESILGELDGAGGFGPMVTGDHVPARLTNAAPGSYEDLQRRARERLGDDAEVAMTMIEVSFMVAKSTSSRRGEYRSALEGLRASMGEAFITELEPLLEERYRQTVDRQQEFMTRVARLTEERFEAPMVNADELNRFFDSGQAAKVVESLGPAFKQHLEDSLASLGVALDELPENDLARRLSEAAGIEGPVRAKRPRNAKTARRTTGPQKRPRSNEASGGRGPEAKQASRTKEAGGARAPRRVTKATQTKQAPGVKAPALRSTKAKQQARGVKPPRRHTTK